MANQEHLDILMKGVEFWNQWRKRNPTIKPDLRDLSLPDANLVQANLSETNLMAANLTRSILKSANLYHADLVGASLRNADLSDADLTWAHVTRSSLAEANLVGARIWFVELIGANVNGADFSNATFGWTKVGDTDLSTAKGLESVNHVGPSTIGIDTIYRSNGNIPEAFLRGAGVPDSLITFMASLTTQAIEFYKCFISFTESDDVFSRKLYEDLKAARVQCWRWKEDAKWGKPLMRSIDDAVRTYDKLVVVCSSQSLASPAVMREIERALQKEDDLVSQGKEGDVLFPIRLDDYIFTGWNHHRKADVVTKHVGDFRHWKNEGPYRRALNRLIHDLKAE